MYTIYTVSDPATIATALRAMAMFFGETGWVDGILKFALLCSLLFILARAVGPRAGLRLDIMLISLLVVMGGFIPRATVSVEQFENNAPTEVVDDVPYAIALPAAVAGQFALFLTDKLNTVMSGVNGDYISAGGELDLFTPARTLLMFATAPLDPARSVDKNFQQTLYFAARYCADKRLGAIDFENGANGLLLFAQTLTLNNITQIYDKDNPYAPGGTSGIPSTCSSARSYIEGVAAGLAANSAGVYEGVLQSITDRSVETRYAPSAGAPVVTFDEILANLNRVIPATAKLNYTAVANIMSYSLLDSIAKYADKPIDQAIYLQRDSGLFQWARDESAQALLVTSTAPRFMDVMFFIFIASTPIVMFLILANPATGMRVGGAYLLFGLWTQSWIPMMAIISGWYNVQITHYMPPGTLGLTPSYLSGLMRHIATSTIAASNMLQAAPYIMFALMTGSIFAMTRMISQAAPNPTHDAAGSGIAGADTIGKGASGAGGMGGAQDVPFGVQQQATLRSGMAIASGGNLTSQAALDSTSGAGMTAAFGDSGSVSSKAVVGAAISDQVSNAAQKVDQARTAATRSLNTMFSHIRSGIQDQRKGQFSAHSSGSSFSRGTSADTGHALDGSTSHSASQTGRSDQTFQTNVGGQAGLDLAGAFRKLGSLGSQQQQAQLADLQKRMQAGQNVGPQLKDLTDKIQQQAQAQIDRGQVGNLMSALGSVLNVGASGRAEQMRNNGVATSTGTSTSGSESDTLRTGRTATVSTTGETSSGGRSDSGTGYSTTDSQSQADTEALSHDLSQLKTATESYQHAQNASMANDAAADTRLSMNTIAAAAANQDTVGNGAAPNKGVAFSNVASQVAGSLGGKLGAFMAGAERTYDALMQQGAAGNVANPQQVAWVAAARELQAMAQSPDVGERTAGLNAIARAAEYGGLSNILHTGAAIAGAAGISGQVGNAIANNGVSGAVAGATARADAALSPGAIAGRQGAVAGGIAAARAASSGGSGRSDILQRGAEHVSEVIAGAAPAVYINQDAAHMTGVAETYKRLQGSVITGKDALEAGALHPGHSSIQDMQRNIAIDKATHQVGARQATNELGAPGQRPASTHVDAHLPPASPQPAPANPAADSPASGGGTLPEIVVRGKRIVDGIFKKDK